RPRMSSRMAMDVCCFRPVSVVRRESKRRRSCWAWATNWSCGASRPIWPRSAKRSARSRSRRTCSISSSSRETTMAEAEFRHAPVMLEEVIEALQIQPQGVYLDGTFGRGGHAREVLKRLDARGRLLLMDRDPTAIAQAQQEFGKDERVRIRH